MRLLGTSATLTFALTIATAYGLIEVITLLLSLRSKCTSRGKTNGRGSGIKRQGQQRRNHI